jgi:type IX secretion system PorP/SprF family membrane protein
MKKFSIVFIGCIILLPFIGCTQDFTFSQFYEKPLLRNPALAGLFKGDIRVSAAYRSQWGSVTVPYKTTAVSVENKLPIGNADDFITAGIQLSCDIAGDIRLKRTQLLPAFNYHKSLSTDKDTYLSLAFMGGIIGNQFDPTQMKLADQYRNGAFNAGNPTLQRIDRTGFNYLDASTGLSFSSSFSEEGRYYLGAALYHFNKPRVAYNDNNDIYLAERWMVNGGFNMPIGEKGKLIGFADYMIQAGNRQFLAGMMYGTRLVEYLEDDDPTTIYFGAFVRWGDAVMPMVKLDMKNFGLGISYDLNISKLQVASNWRGGLEITGSYSGFLRTHSSTLDKVRCVRF